MQLSFSAEDELFRQEVASWLQQNLTGEFVRRVGERLSAGNLTKFLCGIYTPVFSKLKIKKLPHFGIFESYPFLEVRTWIKDNILPEKRIPGEMLDVDIHQ